MQALIDALTQHPGLALVAVFAAALLESTVVIGIAVPGSTVVFVGGILAGLQVLDPWWTAVVAVAGATLGDGFSYWLGRHYHERLRTLWPMRAYPALLERGQAHFARHGGTSVLLGRFLAPLRATVPVIAGMSDMPIVRFTVVNLLSAIAWAGAHLLPGMLFGASLQLAGAVSSRLIILLAGVVAVLWLCVGLLRLAYRKAWPVLRLQRDRIVAWACARTGLVSRVIRSLLDPARPESFGLLVAAVLLLGGFWLFFGVLEDVVSGDPLVQFDRVVFNVLQGLRTAWVDDVMIVATELGSTTVAVAVIAGVSVVLALKRCWRTLAYWLTAVGFAQALVWILKTVLGRGRPVAMLDGMEGFSFPSGHAASSIVLYGFLAVLLARDKTPRAKWAITLGAALLIGFISFSRLYLGAHWLSDVLASLSLGTAWVALLTIAYTQHAHDERLPARALSLAALLALAVAGSATVASHHAADVARYAPRAASAPILLADWQVNGWQRLPPRRADVDGDHEEPLLLQWAGSAERIEHVLQAGGWRRPPAWWSRAALLWLLPSTPIGHLPVLPKFHQGEPPALSFEKELDPTRRMVIRLWPTDYRIGADTDPPPTLWAGLVTLERLTHPAVVITFAFTDPDFAVPAQQLANFLLTHNLAVEVKHTGVLLVNSTR